MNLYYVIPILITLAIIAQMSFFITPDMSPGNKDGRADYRYVLFNNDFWKAGAIFIFGTAYVCAVGFVILQIIFHR